MKKLLTGLLLLICLAGAGYASSDADVEGLKMVGKKDALPPEELWTNAKALFEYEGYELRARNGAKMRETRAKLDEKAKPYVKRSLDDLRQAMRSKDKDKSFYAAWAIVRAYVPDGNLLNWREAVYAHAKDLPEGILPAQVFAEAFYRAELGLISRNAFWNARELYEQFVDDPKGAIVYSLAPAELHKAMAKVASKTKIDTRPATVTQESILLDQFGLPTDHEDKAKFVWDVKNRKLTSKE